MPCNSLCASRLYEGKPYLQKQQEVEESITIGVPLALQQLAEPDLMQNTFVIIVMKLVFMTFLIAILLKVVLGLQNHQTGQNMCTSIHNKPKTSSAMQLFR